MMRITMSMIVIKQEEHELYVLLQKRLNKREHEWFSTWEFPQGKISEFNLLQTAQNELLHEAGISLRNIFAEHDKFNINGEVQSFLPFLVVKAKEHLSFHFITFASGKCKNTEEGSNHRWIGVKGLKSFLISEHICPLNRPALEKLARPAIGYKILNYKYNRYFFGGYRNIIAFDIGGILIKWNDDVLFSNLASVYNCSSSDIMNCLVTNKLRHNLHLGLISHKEVNEKLNTLFKPVPFDLYRTKWEDSIEILHENIDIVFALQKKYPDETFIITSNIDSISEEYLFQRYRLEDVFENTFMSWRMGMSKPNPSFFNTVTDMMNCSHILLIDDKKANILAAEELGWNTYYQQANTSLDISLLDGLLRDWLSEVKK